MRAVLVDGCDVAGSPESFDLEIVLMHQDVDQIPHDEIEWLLL